MKIILTFIIFINILFAQKLIIDAKKFEANDEKSISIFTGNVKMQKSFDILEADKLEVYFNKKSSKKREVLKYIATGNVSFKVDANGKIYEGSGDKIIYEPKNKKYFVTGNGVLKESNDDKKLFGDKIIIDLENGEAKVSGKENKPVRFIIDLEEESKNENN